MDSRDSTHLEVPSEREPAECLGLEGSLAQVSGTLTMLRGRWKLPVLFHLYADTSVRQSQFLPAMPRLAQKVLTEQLRELATDGLVERVDFGEMPLHVEYRLTARGRRLVPLLTEAKRFDEDVSAS